MPRAGLPSFPMPAALDILHLDESVVVVAKPSGLLVHRTSSGSNEEALLQRLRDQLGRRVYPVHRLDRMASGLVAFGLDSRAAQGLQAGLQAADARKEYLVLVRNPCVAEFESRAPLLDDKGVLREAHSVLTRLAPFPEARASLLCARIHTGRYHQIRRHMALAAHHVLGDTRYGKARENRFFTRRYGLARLFLHAWRLDIPRPGGGRLVVTAPLAPDLRAVLERMDGRVGELPGVSSGTLTPCAPSAAWQAPSAGSRAVPLLTDG
jgi:tRNA pseudouridine65 synthase